MSFARTRSDAVVTRIRPRADQVAVLSAADAGAVALATVPAHLRLAKTAADRWSITIRRPGPATLEYPLVLIERHRAWFEVTSAVNGHWSAFATFTGSVAHAVTTALAGAAGRAVLPTAADEPAAGATVTYLTVRDATATGGPGADSEPGDPSVDDRSGAHQPGSVS